jgi:3-hydroxyacyl-CoA dehydrogenase/3-hydroxy-2-methylbutyryl-CoA dehydrogenase
MNIQGKVAVITGGASGLGQATAEAIIAKGGKVMILDRDEKKGPEVAAELGENAAFVQTDVTDEASVQAAIDATKEKFGAIHVCVNCAGVGSAMKTVGRENKPHDLGVFNMVVQINLIGTFNVARLAAAVMAENEPGEDNERGLIVNTASVARWPTPPPRAAWSA